MGATHGCRHDIGAGLLGDELQKLNALELLDVLLVARRRVRRVLEKRGLLRGFHAVAATILEPNGLDRSFERRPLLIHVVQQQNCQILWIIGVGFLDGEPLVFVEAESETIRHRFSCHLRLRSGDLSSILALLLLLDNLGPHFRFASTLLQPQLRLKMRELTAGTVRPKKNL